MALDISTLQYKKVAPARAVTHPLQSSRKTGPIPKHGETLDIDELFRRLEQHRQHLEEARERRRAKKEKKAASGEYHHVPQVAAADFVRTTSPDVRSHKNFHPLSRPVARLQAARPKSDGHITTTQIPFSQVVQDRDLQQLNMLLNAERNPFAQSGALARAAEVDKARNINKLPQRDFDFSRTMSLSSRNQPVCGRSNSLGDRSKTMAGGRSRPKSYLPATEEWGGQAKDVPPTPLPHHVQNHTERRHDWSQNETAITSDGHRETSFRLNMKTSSPVSRFFESKVVARSKVESLSYEVPKSKPLVKRKSAFFATLFRRRVTA